MQHGAKALGQRAHAAQAHGQSCHDVHIPPPPAPDPRALALEMMLVQGMAQAAAVSALRATEEVHGETGAEKFVPSSSVCVILVST